MTPTPAPRAFCHGLCPRTATPHKLPAWTVSSNCDSTQVSSRGLSPRTATPHKPPPVDCPLGLRPHASFLPWTVTSDCDPTRASCVDCVLGLRPNTGLLLWTVPSVPIRASSRGLSPRTATPRELPSVDCSFCPHTSLLPWTVPSDPK